MLLGETITSPASLITGDAATAAAEHEVPTTPSTWASAATRSAPARPPSGEHMASTDSPRSTG